LSSFLREYAPNSEKGRYVVSDVDFIIINNEQKRGMAIEEKCFMAEPSWFQKNKFMPIISHALKQYFKRKGYDFKGYNLIQFENDSPFNGRVFYNGNEIDAEILLDILSMGSQPQKNIEQKLEKNEQLILGEDFY
jgi:hypothetical protein